VGFLARGIATSGLFLINQSDSKVMSKTKRGGKRVGAGRKPLALEDNVKEAIKKALEAAGGDDAMTEVWQKIIEKAKAGSDRHAQILLNYIYGKPVDNINVQGGLVLNFTRKIVK
jgi:hypothetical protein